MPHFFPTRINDRETRPGIGQLPRRISKGRVEIAGLQPVEILLTLIVAFPMLGTFFPIESYLAAPTLANPLGSPVDSGRTTTVSLVLLYVIVAFLFSRKAQVMRAAVLTNWPLFVFAGWAMVTCLWAEIPIFSFNRTGRMLLAILYGIYIAQNFDRQGITRILCHAVLIGLIGSALVTILYPGLSRVVDFRGAYRGAFSHKNVLGSVSALAMMFSAFAFGPRLVPRWLCVVTFVLGSVFVIISNSVGALIALILAASFAIYLSIAAPKPNRDRVLALMVVGVLGVLGFLMAETLSSLVELTGRDATLTGRTDVWRFVQSMIDVKPFWGWGHGIWQMPVFQTYVLQELDWPAPHAHNTWLDFRLQLGLPGLLLGVYIGILAIKRVVVAIVICQDSEYLLWIAVVVFQGIRCNTETMYVDPSSIEMFWFSLAFSRLAIMTRTVRTAGQTGAWR